MATFAVEVSDVLDDDGHVTGNVNWVIHLPEKEEDRAGYAASYVEFLKYAIETGQLTQMVAIFQKSLADVAAAKQRSLEDQNAETANENTAHAGDTGAATG